MLFLSPSRRMALDVATGHVLLVALCRVLARGDAEPVVAWLQLFVVASTVALGTLLATWATLGSGPFWKRAVDALVGWAALDWLHTVALRGDPFELASRETGWTGGAMRSVGPAMYGVLAAGWYARRRGWAWRHAREIGDPPATQFSLPEAFWATAVAAWLFSLDRAIPVGSSFWQGGVWPLGGGRSVALEIVVGMFGVTFVLAHRTAAALVGSGPTLRLWLAVSVFAGVYVIGLIGWGAAVNDMWDARRAAREATLSATLTVAYLLAFRAVGWRIDRPAAADGATEVVVREANEFATLCEAAGAASIDATRREFVEPAPRDEGDQAAAPGPEGEAGEAVEVVAAEPPAALDDASR